MGDQVMCTYCFHKFAKHQVLYRCVNPDCQAKNEDRIYADYREAAPTLMGKVLAAPARKAGLFSRFRTFIRFSTQPNETVICDVCGIETRILICPACHETLARGALEIRQPIISVVGGVGVGKTCYIATLLHTLIENDLEYGLSGRFIGDAGQDLWNTKYHVPIFDHLELPSPTLPARIDSSIKTPLIYRITVSSTGNKFNFNFFDAAGEDMQSEEAINDSVQQLFHSDGVVFLLDPLQMPAVQELLRVQGVKKFPPINRKTAPIRVLRRYVDLYGDLYNGEKVSRPVAFALSKLDSLYSILPPNSLLPPKIPVKDSWSNQTLKIAVEAAISREVSNYVQLWSRDVYSIITHNFTTYRFFGISSLGVSPAVDDNKPFGVFPYRVEQPFLWILEHLHDSKR